MSDEGFPGSEVWMRIRPVVHEKATTDADEFLAEFEVASSHFLDDMDHRRFYTGRKSMTDLEKLSKDAVDLANASRSDKAWSLYHRTPVDERTNYAKRILRGAIRKDERA